MGCDKHGWVASAPCTSCLDEVMREKEHQQQFVDKAAMFFFERRRYYGMDADTLERLRQECWADARALYRSGYQVTATETMPGE